MLYNSVDIWRDTMMSLALTVLFCLSLCGGVVLNSKSSETVEDPNTFDVYELDCRYQGAGVYTFEGPDTIQILSIDRLTTESHLRPLVKLNEIRVKTGTLELCNYITVPATTKFTVEGELCVCSLFVWNVKRGYLVLLQYNVLPSQRQSD